VVIVGPLAGGILAAARTVPESRRPNLWVLSELPLAPLMIPAELVWDFQKSGHLIFVEEHVAQGSAGASLVQALVAAGTPPSRFTHRAALGYPTGHHGSQVYHRQECGLDPVSILKLATDTP
jgi:transketolase